MCLRLFVGVFLQCGMCNETEPDGGDCRSKGRPGICVKENDAPFRICNTSRARALDSLSLSHGRRKWIRRHHELCRSIFGFASRCSVGGTNSRILAVRLLPGPWCKSVNTGIVSGYTMLYWGCCSHGLKCLRKDVFVSFKTFIEHTVFVKYIHESPCAFSHVPLWHRDNS